MPDSKSANCPVCSKPQAAEFKPFCSAGCKDRDLLQWLGEGYKLAGPPSFESAMADNQENQIPEDSHGN